MSDFFYQLEGHLRIGSRNSTIGGQRVALLEAIDTTGSISAAARALGISYKGAWDAVNAMNSITDTPLVSGVTGGARGGGSVLSARGQQLIRVYRAAMEEQANFVARLNRRVSYLQDDIDLMGRLGMLTSARNQLFGRVCAVNKGIVNAEVELELPGGDRLIAVITRASVDNLGLEIGVTVTALIKASWIIVAAGEQTDAHLSTRNRLVGTVDYVVTDSVNSEIVIRLPGGFTLAAVVTRESADVLGLRAGDTATALFNASSVILAQSG